MARLPLCYYPNPVLLTVADPVTEFDDTLQQLIDDMIETMYAENGVGLAAPQIGISKQLAVIDVLRDGKEPLVLINPTVSNLGELDKEQEGCLSMPGAYETVKRATAVTLNAFDRHNQSYEIQADGLLAKAIQHECDHLDGRLYIHHLNSFKRARTVKQFERHLRMLKKQSSSG